MLSWILQVLKAFAFHITNLHNRCMLHPTPVVLVLTSCAGVLLPRKAERDEQSWTRDDTSKSMSCQTVTFKMYINSAGHAGPLSAPCDHIYDGI